MNQCDNSSVEVCETGSCLEAVEVLFCVGCVRSLENVTEILDPFVTVCPSVSNSEISLNRRGLIYIQPCILYLFSRGTHRLSVARSAICVRTSICRTQNQNQMIFYFFRLEIRLPFAPPLDFQLASGGIECGIVMEEGLPPPFHS